jgi:hypothetical protein
MINMKRFAIFDNNVQGYPTIFALYHGLFKDLSWLFGERKFAFAFEMTLHENLKAKAGGTRV